MNTTDVFYLDGHLGDPELQYTSLSSDIGVNCPNSAIARKIAAGRTERRTSRRGNSSQQTKLTAAEAAPAPVYRYVLTATPSGPMHMLGSPFPGRYAFHTLDSVFLFNTSAGALINGARPTAADARLTRRLREDIGAFVRSGAMPSTWKTYPEATMEIAALGVVREIEGGVDYHCEACAFWEHHGFFKYSWAGN